jgi:hypothetical protein
MPLVLSERDYKLVTLFSKIAGIFVFAAGTVTITDHGRPLVGLFLVLLGTLITLAPVPISVVQPRSYAEAKDDELTVAE